MDFIWNHGIKAKFAADNEPMGDLIISKYMNNDCAEWRRCQALIIL